MTYINIVGDQEEHVTLWTGGANYAGTMDPGKFKIETYGSSSDVEVVGPRKYLDARLSEEHGIPIYRPLTSGPRRNTVPTGYVFTGKSVAQVGVIAANGKSPDVRSERNASDVTSGGTSSGKKTKGPVSYGDLTFKPGYKTGRRGPCDPGYLLQKKSNGRWACVRLDKHRYAK